MQHQSALGFLQLYLQALMFGLQLLDLLLLLLQHPQPSVEVEQTLGQTRLRQMSQTQLSQIQTERSDFSEEQ